MAQVTSKTEEVSEIVLTLTREEAEQLKKILLDVTEETPAYWGGYEAPKVAVSISNAIESAGINVIGEDVGLEVVTPMKVRNTSKPAFKKCGVSGCNKPQGHLYTNNTSFKSNY